MVSYHHEKVIQPAAKSDGSPHGIKGGAISQPDQQYVRRPYHTDQYMEETSRGIIGACLHRQAYQGGQNPRATHQGTVPAPWPTRCGAGMVKKKSCPV